MVFVSPALTIIAESSTGFLTRDLEVVKAYRAIKGEEARKEFIEQRTEMMKKRREVRISFA